ncbi:MAG: HlyD family efflux transporter periplasmic adaptor subunit [Planctomycetota bacterium]
MTRRTKYAMAGLMTTSLILVGIITQWATGQPTTSVEPGSSQQDPIDAGNDVQSRPKGGSTLPVAVARLGDLDEPSIQHQISGVIETYQTSSLSFERGGRIDSIFVRAGDPISEGQILAKLDQSQAEAEVEAARGRLKAAEAVLSKLVAGPRRQTIDAAAAAVAEARSATKYAESDYLRQQLLTRRNAGSTQDLDLSRQNYTQADERLKSLQAQLDELNEGTRKEDIAEGEARVVEAKASLATAEAMLEDGLITAPFDGLATDRRLDPGAVISPGTPVVSILDNRLEGRFGIPPSEISSLSRAVNLEVVAGSLRIPASIDRMEPRLDPTTQTRLIYTSFDFSGQSNRPVVGQSATLVWTSTKESSNQARSQFWIPTDALVRAGRGLWNLYIIDLDSKSSRPSERLGKVEARLVELINTRGAQSLVRGTLDANQLVVIGGNHRITAGMNVRWVLAEDKKVQELEVPQ